MSDEGTAHPTQVRAHDMKMNARSVVDVMLSIGLRDSEWVNATRRWPLARQRYVVQHGLGTWLVDQERE